MRNKKLLDEIDWAKTAIGPMSEWPLEMQAVVSMALSTEFPVCTGWGPDLVQIYNSAYNPIYGEKHPHAFGRPIVDSWPEIWQFLKPAVDNIRETGVPLWFPDTMLALAKQGIPEECWFDFCYSPVFSRENSVLGVVSIANEKTSTVVYRRRQPSLSLSLSGEAGGGWEQLSSQLKEALHENDMDARLAVMFAADHHTGILVSPKWTVRAASDVVSIIGREIQGRISGQSDVVVVANHMMADPELSDMGVAVPVFRMGGRLESVLYLVPHKLVNFDGFLEFCRALSDHLQRLIEYSDAQAEAITDIREQLDQREEFYSFLFQNVDAAAFYAVTSGGVQEEETILAVNPKASEMLGFSDQELIGKTREDLFFANDVNLAAAVKERSQSRVFRGDLVCRTKTGQAVPVEVSSKLVTLKNGQTRSVTLMYDISRRQQQEKEKAEHARYEAMSLLTGGLAHDFNNLLTVIINSLELAGDYVVGQNQALRHINNAIACAEKGASLIGQLLAYSRRSLQDIKVHQLDAFLIESRGLVAASLGPIHDLKVDVAPDLPLCRFDAAQMTTILLNLAANARDAMPGGGALTLRADASSVRGDGRQFVLLRVEDTGVGVDLDLLPHIFEPYVTSKSIGQGSGLGLAMVKGLMTQIGGDVEVETRSGRGTCFTLKLPVAEGALPESPPAGGQATSVVGRHLLLVDDNDLLREQLKTLLEASGLVVHAVSDAKEALRVLEAGNSFEIVLSDIVMPGGMSGTQLAEEIGRCFPSLAVLLMTGYDPGSDVYGAGDKRFVVLQKPFSRTTLLKAIGEVLQSGCQS